MSEFDISEMKNPEHTNPTILRIEDVIPKDGTQPFSKTPYMPLNKSRTMPIAFEKALKAKKP